MKTLIQRHVLNYSKTSCNDNEGGKLLRSAIIHYQQWQHHTQHHQLNYWEVAITFPSLRPSAGKHETNEVTVDGEICRVHQLPDLWILGFRVWGGAPCLFWLRNCGFLNLRGSKMMMLASTYAPVNNARSWCYTRWWRWWRCMQHYIGGDRVGMRIDVWAAKK